MDEWHRYIDSFARSVVFGMHHIQATFPGLSQRDAGIVASNRTCINYELAWMFARRQQTRAAEERLARDNEAFSERYKFLIRYYVSNALVFVFGLTITVLSKKFFGSQFSFCVCYYVILFLWSKTPSLESSRGGL
jgi:hypothetical protein